MKSPQNNQTKALANSHVITFSGSNTTKTFMSKSLGQPLLGLDLGTKTIGLARTDPNWRLVVPMITRHRSRFSNDLTALTKIITEEHIGGLVLGLPINMDGSEGRRAQSTRAFARNLVRAGLPDILLWDERLSSFSAEACLSETGLPPHKHKQKIDSSAAVIILEGALKYLIEQTRI